MSENENYENEFENENSIEKEEEIPCEEQLIEMGFDSVVAQKACKFNENDIEKCLYWIYYNLDNENLGDENNNDNFNPYKGFVNKFAKNINKGLDKMEKEEEEIKKLEEEEEKNKNNNSFDELKNSVINDVNNENNNNNNENNNNNNENNNNIENENNNNNNINETKNNENNNNENNNNEKINNNEKKEEIEESNNKLNDSAELEKEINEMSQSNNMKSQNEKNKTNRTIDSNMYISNNEISNQNNNNNNNEKIDNSNNNENKKPFTHIENINFYISILKKILKVSVNKNLLIKIFKTIKKIIENILNYPDDEKYKSIKKNNEKFHEIVGQYNSALKILEEIGFVENEDNILIMSNVDNDLLTNTQTILENEIEQLNEI